MTLAEREHELSILNTIFSDGLNGDGGVAIVTGATATGKTALLAAGTRLTENRGARYLRAAASRIEQNVPLGVISELLRGIDLPAENARSISDLLASDTRCTSPFRSTGELDLEVPQSIGKLLLDVVRRQPLLIGVDDLHYADVPSLVCLAYLARRMRSTSMSMILTECTSPHAAHPLMHTEIMGLPYCQIIRLHLLSVEGVAEMIQGSIEGAPTPHLADPCHRLSGGNPLLVRALLEDYLAAGRPGSTEFAPGDAFEQALLTCLYRSGSTVVDTARALAVMGRPTSPAVLAETLGLKPEAINQAKAELNRSGLLVSGWFRHPALPAAILDNMVPDQCAALHADAARALHLHGAPGHVLAEHLMSTDSVHASWVAPTLRQAGEQALAAGEIGSAVRCLRAGHEAYQDPRQKMAVKSLLSCAEWLVDPANVQRHLPELIEATHSGTLPAEYIGPLVCYLLWHGRPLDAITLVDAVEGRSAGGCAASDAIDLRGVREWPAFAYPELDGQDDAAGRQRPPAGRAHATSVTSEQRRGFDLLISVLRRQADGDTVAEAEQLIDASRLDFTTLAPVSMALAALIYADELDKADMWCEMLVKGAEQNPTPMYRALFPALQSIIRLRQGRFIEAADCARSALAVIAPPAWGVVVGLPLAGMLQAATTLGNREEAAEYYRVTVPDAMFQTPFGLLYLQSCGYYHLADGRFRSALAYFQECGELMIRWRIDVPALIPWRTDAAQAVLKLGDAARARDLTQQQLAMLGPAPSRTQGMSLRVLAAATELRKRPPLLEKSIDVLETTADQYELALTASELSRVHRVLGERDKADAIESRTRHLTERYECGPAPDGMFPEVANDQFTGPVATAGTLGAITRLSEAEWRVAALAARGLSNRQISSRLFITVSTVEQHLTRVYRKLSVNSRAELPIELQYVSDSEGPSNAQPNADSITSKIPAAFSLR